MVNYFKKPKVFISYRREDAMAAGRLDKSLVERIGRKKVFKDNASLDLGANWKKEIKDEISKCQLFFVVIDESFTSSTGQLFDESDPIRFEIEAALLEKKLIIPILIDGAGMPAENEMPEELRPFVLRIGYPIDSTYWDRDFADMEKRYIRSGYLQIKQSFYQSIRTFFFSFFILLLFSITAWCLLNEIFVPAPKFGSVTDLSGTKYRTIEIGGKDGKLFLAENLNYHNIGSYCLDSIGQACVKYGRYYLWDTANVICSCLGKGWRLPNPDDLEILQKKIIGDPHLKNTENKFLFFALQKKRAKYFRTTEGQKKVGFRCLMRRVPE